jgi:RNA polymerase sigma-70 factor, ECF subfamily
MGDELEPAELREQVTQACAAGSARLNDILERHQNTLRGIAAGLMRRERPNHTWQPTDLVNEAYLCLVDQSRVGADKTRFFYSCFAKQCRRLLVQHARQRRAARRGGHAVREELLEQAELGVPGDEYLVHLDDQLQQLERIDSRLVRLAELRMFAGLNNEECAEAMGLSLRTIATLKRFLNEHLGGKQD